MSTPSRRRPPKCDLKALRYDWEAGTQVVTELKSLGGTLCVVTELGGRFCCLRYFQIGKKWYVSADLRDVSGGPAVAWMAVAGSSAQQEAYDRGRAAGNAGS